MPHLRMAVAPATGEDRRGLPAAPARTGSDLQGETLMTAASVDTDRLALSHELAQLADRFMLEAALWRDPEAKRELERTARHLAELSRGTLWTSDLPKLEQYARAGDLLIRNVEGVRRFFRIILTPPASEAEKRPMTDWTDDPAARDWAQHALDDLLPKLRDSYATVSIVPDLAGIDDIKFALELGLTIMLDKPLILAIVPGRNVPARLARAAAELIEFDEDNPARTAAAIRAAVDRIDTLERGEPPC